MISIHWLLHKAKGIYKKAYNETNDSLIEQTIKLSKTERKKTAGILK